MALISTGFLPMLNCKNLTKQGSDVNQISELTWYEETYINPSYWIRIVFTSINK